MENKVLFSIDVICNATLDYY